MVTTFADDETHEGSRGQGVNNPETLRSRKVVGEVQLRKYGQFLNDWMDKLEEIEKLLENNKCTVYNQYRNCAADIIQISVEQHNSSIAAAVNMTSTDNKILNKVILVLTALCSEARERKLEASKHYHQINMLGNEISSKSPIEQMTALSRALPQLQELSNFIDRIHIILVEFLRQMSALYSAHNTTIIDPTNLHFDDVMHNVAELLVVLLTLDHVIRNAKLQTADFDAWVAYKRILHVEGGKRHKSLLQILERLEGNILAGCSFQNGIKKICSALDIKESQLADEFTLFVRNMITLLQNETTQDLDFDGDTLWPKVICLFILSTHLFGLHDKRLFKQIYDMTKKLPTVDLCTSTGFCCPGELIQTHIVSLKNDEKKFFQQLGSYRIQLLEQKCASLPQNILRLTSEITAWTIKFEHRILSTYTTSPSQDINLTVSDLKACCDILLQGTQLARQTKSLLANILNLHVGLGKPVTKSVVTQLCHLTELLKMIELMYQRQNGFHVAEQMTHLLQFLRHEIFKVLEEIRKRILLVTKSPGAGKRTNTDLDTLSAVVLAQQVVCGIGSPSTGRQCLICRLAMSIARRGSMLRDEEIDSLYKYLRQMDRLVNRQTLISQFCDTSFLYYHHAVLLPVHLSNQKTIRRLPMFLQALPAINDPTFKAHAETRLITGTIRNICDQVETSLRVHVHKHVQQLTCEPSNAITDTLTMDPVPLFDAILSIRNYVENHLETTFYNLTAVALHDSSTYDAMRTLAKMRFGLDLRHTSNLLPCHTLEQGVDVLDIMRNINLFVDRYHYNMNNQIFVEATSPNKHFNTISINHVSNNIRCHGRGVINTTVNITYQFLRNKLYIFSQFLFDEQIKSRLSKDAKYQDRDCYPYDRADKFNKGIRKLGVTTDGLTFLDQFRKLITHIGNAMGYVRMMRSGAMHIATNTLPFLSKAKTNFAQQTDDEFLCESAAAVDRVIENLTRDNFAAEGINYFKLLVDAFANDFRDPLKNPHLANFYIIVPPLIINYVEFMVNGKEKLARRSKEGAVFTEDGFAMGLAYVLTVLDQHDAFAGLHWFSQSVRQKLTQERAVINEKPTHAQNEDDALSKANLLTAKRLDDYQQQFEWLAFNLNSAKIFFHKQVVLSNCNQISN